MPRPPLALVLVTMLLAGCAAEPRSSADEGAGDVGFETLTLETGLGRITAILFCDETPATCAFMRGLAEEGYYDGRAFGRVVPGFVIQEVDRTGGTTDQPERVIGEFGTNVSFSAGAFGIARDADPDSGGSEFFIMDHPASSLWGNYTAFAQVIEGMDVVHAIARVPAVRTGPASSVAASPPGSPVYFGVHDRVPVEPVVIERATWGAASLPASDAARYPLVVAETYRSDTHRSTLEWPRDLRAGEESALAFYAWSRDTSATSSVRDTPPPELDEVAIAIAGPSPSEATGIAANAAHGTIRFSWRPPAPGEYRFRLLQADAEIGLANVTVAG